MSNHHRGLWGYHGFTACGHELTVQATGIGGPSAAVVLGELASLGVRRVVRLGACVAPGTGGVAGAAIVVGTALAGDGTSIALGAQPGSAIEADPELTEALVDSTGLPGPSSIRGLDVYSPALVGGNGGSGLEDLQTAGLLSASAKLGIAAGAALVVGAVGGRWLEDEALDGRLLRLADSVVVALEA